MTVPWYYDCMQPIDLQLNTMFAASFPEQYQDYKTVSAAGKFLECDASVWLGRAVLHKLQVEMHRDGLDPPGMPAASFPSGQYSGGEMYLPDIGVKLAYVSFISAHNSADLAPQLPPRRCRHISGC